MAARTKLSAEHLAPATIEEAHRQLAQLRAEQAGIEAMLAGIPEREKELLDADADNAAFSDVDIDRRRGHHKLQALAGRHDTLIHTLHKLEDEARRALWLSFVDRYEIQAKKLAETGRELQRQEHALAAIIYESQRAGFTQYTQLVYLQMSRSGLIQDILEGQASYGPALRTALTTRVTPRVYVVRFLEWTMWGTTPATTTAYRRGQEAGFDADAAWTLVLKQSAEWADPANIPPRPIKRKRLREPVNAIPEPRPRRQGGGSSD